MRGNFPSAPFICTSRGWLWLLPDSGPVGRAGRRAPGCSCRGRHRSAGLTHVDCSRVGVHTHAAVDTPTWLVSGPCPQEPRHTLPSPRVSGLVIPTCITCFIIQRLRSPVAPLHGDLGRRACQQHNEVNIKEKTDQPS